MVDGPAEPGLDRTRRRLFYASALALALLARAAVVAPMDPAAVQGRWSTASDAILYDRFGWNLASVGTFGVGDRPSAFASPAYPILLAGVYSVAGHSPGAARWTQVVLGLMTVVLLGRLAGRLAGPRAELAALAIGAVYPPFLYFTREIMSEGLFILALCGSLWAAARLGERADAGTGALLGACAATLILTRPTGLVLLPGALILVRPWGRDGRRARIRALLVAGAVLALLWVPWMLRNKRAFGEVVPLDTHGGWALYVGQLMSRGLSPDEVAERVGYGRYQILDGALPGGARGELEADRRAKQEAMQMIRADPLAFAATWPRNVWELWLAHDLSDVARAGGGRRLLTLVGLATYLPILGLGLMALVRLARERRWPPLCAAVALLLASTAVHAVVLGGKRYRSATIDPVLIVLAGGEIARRVRRKSAPA